MFMYWFSCLQSPFRFFQILIHPKRRIVFLFRLLLLIASSKVMESLVTQTFVTSLLVVSMDAHGLTVRSLDWLVSDRQIVLPIDNELMAYRFWPKLFISIRWHHVTSLMFACSIRRKTLTIQRHS